MVEARFEPVLLYHILLSEYSASISMHITNTQIESKFLMSLYVEKERQTWTSDLKKIWQRWLKPYFPLALQAKMMSYFCLYPNTKHSVGEWKRKYSSQWIGIYCLNHEYWIWWTSLKLRFHALSMMESGRRHQCKRLYDIWQLFSFTSKLAVHIQNRSWDSETLKENRLRRWGIWSQKMHFGPWRTLS